jgi:hypothetical protein
MKVSLTGGGARNGGIALALASIALLGCARKVQIEVPADFHGRVHIVCGGLSVDRPGTLRIAASGDLEGTTCPARQADVVVTRLGSGAPVDTSVLWMTTGDGLVREITFDVK